MSTNPDITALTEREYEAGFTTHVESETVPRRVQVVP